jgi:hypothetical protein
LPDPLDRDPDRELDEVAHDEVEGPVGGAAAGGGLWANPVVRQMIACRNDPRRSHAARDRLPRRRPFDLVPMLTSNQIFAMPKTNKRRRAEQLRSRCIVASSSRGRSLERRRVSTRRIGGESENALDFSDSRL